MSQAIPFPSHVRKTQRRRILNAQTIKGLKPPVTGRVDYFDDSTPGLTLRITSNDVRTWTWIYRNANAQQKRLTLGRLPAVGLADARELAREAQRQVAKGLDPASVKQAQRDVLTFGALAADYIKLHAKPNKKSWKEDERQIEGDLGRWKNRPAAEIARKDVRALLDKRIADGALVGANRTRALVSKIFNFAVEREFVDRNPVQGIKKPGSERRRERVLSDDEIRRIWQACDTQPARVGAWFRLRLVTAQRGGEILQMRWRDLDEPGEWWTIPAEFVKNAQGHRVYLNAKARELIGALHRKPEAVWVFPKSVMGDYKHVARRLAQGTRANIVKASDTPIEPRKRAAADFTGHDLRRTAASLMASGGVPRFVIGRILNHSQDKDITGVYDRYSYDAEKRAAIEFWGTQLDAILSGGSAKDAGRFRFTADADTPAAKS